MSAASDRERGVRPAAGARRAAVVALLLAVACGGERRAESAVADTSAADAPVTPPEPVTAVVPDTSGDQPAVRDSSADISVPGSAIARRSVDTSPEARPAPAAPKAPATPAPAPKPAAQTPDTQPTQPPARQEAAAAAQDTATSQSPAAAEPAPAQTAPLRDEYHQAPRDTVVQAVYDGWKQYNLNCARCHGEDVLGTTIAPHLIMSVKPEGPINTKESFVQVVCAGRPEKGMPAWCPLGLEMQKIEQIYSYVKGRSEGEIGPGRPALREEG